MKKKRWVIVATIIIVLAALIAIVFKYYITNERYNVALSMEKEKDVLSAVDTYVEIIDFKDSRERVEKLSKYLFDDNYHIQFGLTARINDEENGTVTWEYALYDEKNTLYEQAKSRISDVLGDVSRIDHALYQRPIATRTRHHAAGGQSRRLIINLSGDQLAQQAHVHRRIPYADQQLSLL